MRTTILLVLFYLLAYTTKANTSSNSDDIIGVWQTENRTLQVQIFKKEEKYFGKIISVKDKSKNKNIGQLILWDMIYDVESSEWNNGELRLPEMNHSVNCYLTLTKNDTIVSTGYHGLRMFGKEMKLYRIK